MFLTRWFQIENRIEEEPMPPPHPEQIPISERCMVDGSWTHDALFSGYGWTWMTARGVIQLLGARNQLRRISPLHYELEALFWAMECMLQLSTCQAFGTDCKDLVSMIQDPWAWPSFSTELNEFSKLKSRLSAFSIVFIPRSENVSSDSLAKIARSFHRTLYYIDCSVPVWFPRPPQAWVI